MGAEVSGGLAVVASRALFAALLLGGLSIPSLAHAGEYERFSDDFGKVAVRTSDNLKIGRNTAAARRAERWVSGSVDNIQSATTLLIGVDGVTLTDVGLCPDPNNAYKNTHVPMPLEPCGRSSAKDTYGIIDIGVRDTAQTNAVFETTKTVSLKSFTASSSDVALGDVNRSAYAATADLGAASQAIRDYQRVIDLAPASVDATLARTYIKTFGLSYEDLGSGAVK